MPTSKPQIRNCLRKQTCFLTKMGAKTHVRFSLFVFILVVSHFGLAQDSRLAARREDRLFQSAAAGTVRAESEDVM